MTQFPSVRVHRMFQIVPLFWAIGVTNRETFTWAVLPEPAATSHVPA